MNAMLFPTGETKSLHLDDDDDDSLWVFNKNQSHERNENSYAFFYGEDVI